MTGTPYPTFDGSAECYEALSKAFQANSELCRETHPEIAAGLSEIAADAAAGAATIRQIKGKSK